MRRYLICSMLLSLSYMACRKENVKSETKLSIRSGIKLWLNAQVPYVIADGFTDEKIAEIKWAVNEISKKTVVSIVPRSQKMPERDYVVFVPEKKFCGAKMGRRGGMQTIKVTTRCKQGSIAHELLHTLGFIHEHLNPTANIKFDMSKAKSGMESNFEDPRAKAVTEYDGDSIMHYDSWTFSICDHPNDEKWNTVSRKNLPPQKCRVEGWEEVEGCMQACAVSLNADGTAFERQRQYLTDSDIEGVNKVYQYLLK